MEYLNNLRIPVVACNLNRTTEERLQVPNLKHSVILNIGTERVGVVGYLTPTTMVGILLSIFSKTL